MASAGGPRSFPPRAVRVACAVIERGDAFLVARRGPKQSNAGLWEFPGGKIREHETAEAALLRELREELDADAAVLRPLTPRVHAYPWMTIELFPFVCSLAQGELVPREHEDIRWVRAAEAKLLSWAEADIPVLEEYCRERCDP